MSISSWIQQVETDAGIIHVDINEVLAKSISQIALVPHEVDAFLKWVLSETEKAQSTLTAATPVIAALAGLATAATTGNPAVGAEVATAVSSVDAAVNEAQTIVTAMNKASAALNATGGGGTLVSDTSAIVAAASAMSNGNATVANVTAAALNAAKTIQALVPPKAA